MPKTKKKKVEGPGQRRNSGGRPWKRLPESGSGEQRPRQIEETKGRGNERSQDKGDKKTEKKKKPMSLPEPYSDEELAEIDAARRAKLEAIRRKEAQRRDAAAAARARAAEAARLKARSAFDMLASY